MVGSTSGVTEMLKFSVKAKKLFYVCFLGRDHKISGPICLKLTMLLVDILLNF